MKRKGKYDSRLGKLFFILPAVIIILIGVYAYVELNSPATLVVTAQQPGGSPIQGVSAAVAGRTGVIPWTLSLPQGNYIVNFTAVPFFYTPPPKDVSLPPGQTSYAVGVYQPITRVIQVTPSGFNATTVTALHGVTTVVWTNPSGSVVILAGSGVGTVPLTAGQRTSYVFPAAGNYAFTINSSNATVTVQVQ